MSGTTINKENIMKKNKKLLSVILAALLVLAFAACQVPAAEVNLHPASEDSSYTLEDIAALNGVGVDELNVYTNADGYIGFLGNKYTDMKITDADSAAESLDYVSGLLGLDGIELEIYKENTSPVSGNTYYLFIQLASAEIDGEVVPAKFYSSSVKVIADKDGNSLGFSSDLNHSIQGSFSSDDIIPKDEAEDFVAALIFDVYGTEDCNIYIDYTTFSYWDDAGTTGSSSGANIAPAWIVMTDSIKENSGNYPYTAWIVYALKDSTTGYPFYDHPYYFSVITSVDSYTLDFVNEMDDIYTSELYFMGLEDAGEYTYTLDMTWAKEAGTGYNAGDTMEVTIPLMYDEENGLYYLGSYNDRLAVCNSYDFLYASTSNSVVTETPEDINSWHFQIEQNEAGAEYFFDVNYVMASYNALYTAYHCFNDRYGITAANGLPMMLAVYDTSTTSIYPESVYDFNVNAYNAGQSRDWNLFITSPMYSGCAEVGTMAHEYTHGIQFASSLTSSMSNEYGAIAEAYADILGEGISYIYGYKGEEYKWDIGSYAAEIARCFDTPEEYGNPKYLFGKWYLSPVSSMFLDMSDNGAVHSNCGIINYLSYMMCEDTSSDADALLTMEEREDLWLESQYCCVAGMDYQAIGRYVIFASDCTGLSELKSENVKRLVNELGFNGDFTELESLIEAEDGLNYNVTVDASESVNSENAGYCFYIADLSGTTREIMGETDESGNVQYRTGLENGILALYISDTEAETIMAELVLGYAYPGDITVYIADYDLAFGESLSVSDGYTLNSFCTAGDIDSFDMLEAGASFTPEYYGNYYVVMVCDDEPEEYYVLCVTVE